MVEFAHAVELVQTLTDDGVSLHGLWCPRKPDQQSDIGEQNQHPVVILIHGVGGNFYSSRLLETVSDELCRNGFNVLRVNTRGHDGLYHGLLDGRSTRLGAAFERVSDCVLDIDAWIEFALGKGNGKVILFGHSLGAIKVVYSQACQPHHAVTRIIACSGPCLRYDRFAASARSEQFQQDWDEANRRIQLGRERELFEAQVPFPLWISPESFVDKYGPDNRYDILHHAEELSVASLFTYGSLELSSLNNAFKGLPEALAAIRSDSDRWSIQTLKGADHFYNDRLSMLATRVVDWLGKTNTK